MEADLPPRKMMIPDPSREQNLEDKRANTAAAQAAQEQERQDMLHTLYVNAGSFITTGEQLDSAIDKVFDDDGQFANDESRGLNIWHFGEPDRIADLLRRNTRQSERNRKAVDDLSQDLMQDRKRRIGEELTGGKA